MALFSYDAPVVTAISPDGGRTVGGYGVTVSGYNFGSLGEFALSPEGGGPFGPSDVVPSASMTSYSDSKMVFSLPGGIGANRVVFVRAYPAAGQVCSSSCVCLVASSC